MPSEFDGVNFPDVPENLKDEGKMKEFLKDNIGGLNYLLRRLKYFYNTVKDFMNNAVTTFLNLTDTPSDYTGNAGKYTRVKSSEDGLEFTDEVVETTGDQTIGGVKTFSSIPVLPSSDPTSDNEAVRKKYVDDQLSSVNDEKVKADSGDSTAGYLDSKVDNATIEVDTSNHQLRVKDGGISQAKLKTSAGEVSTGGSGIYTLPGGQYGFYPQVKASQAGANSSASIGYSGSYINFGTSYATKIYLKNDGTCTTYAQQRYITSSGRDHWIFLLVDKETKQIIASYQAPDHPCYGQGGDEIDIPHPFGSYDSTKHEIVLVDNSILTELKPLINRKNTLLTLINEKCIIDDYVRPKYEPREIIEIDEYGDLKGDVLATIKTPDWAKIKINKDEIQLKRRMVEKLPDFILYKKLRLAKGGKQ